MQKGDTVYLGGLEAKVSIASQKQVLIRLKNSRESVWVSPAELSGVPIDGVCGPNEAIPAVAVAAEELSEDKSTLDTGLVTTDARLGASERLEDGVCHQSVD